LPEKAEKSGTHGAMKSTDKISVLAKPFDKYGGKHWVLVQFPDGTEWVPSFEDLYRIVRAVCHCEDEKYPPPAKGRFYVRDFLKACCEEIPPGCEQTEYWEQLRERFKFIDRD
jgi:hypothetical protein